MPAEGRGERLNADEDAALRRLHWFELLGCELSNALRTLKDGFRNRDRRTHIREPGQTYDKSGEPVRAKKTSDSYWVG